VKQKNNEREVRSSPIIIKAVQYIKKSKVGRICWKGRFWAWSEREKEWWMMRAGWWQRWVEKLMRWWIETRMHGLTEWIWKLIPKTRWCIYLNERSVIFKEKMVCGERGVCRHHLCTDTGDLHATLRHPFRQLVDIITLLPVLEVYIFTAG